MDTRIPEVLAALRTLRNAAILRADMTTDSFMTAPSSEIGAWKAGYEAGQAIAYVNAVRELVARETGG